jgi:hypothetical protein
MSGSLSRKSDPPARSVSEVLAKLSEKNYGFNFDVTLELNTPKLQVGNLRIHGRVESVAKK